MDVPEVIVSNEHSPRLSPRTLPKLQHSPKLGSMLNHEETMVIRKIKSQESMMKSYSSTMSTRSETTCEVKHITCVDEKTIEHTTRKSSAVYFDVEGLGESSTESEVEEAVEKVVEELKNKVDGRRLEEADRVFVKAELVPGHAARLTKALTDTLREEGHLEKLADACVGEAEAVLPPAKILSRVMTKENREHLGGKGRLREVAKAALKLAKRKESPESTKVGASLLGSLFKEGEGTCRELVRGGGLDAILSDCGTEDPETQLGLAEGLANLTLFGGSDVKAEMVKEKAPLWLAHLASSGKVDEARYQALIAAAVLASERGPAAVGGPILRLVARFISSVDPADIKNGRCKEWLLRLIPLLASSMEEAASLAAFHFLVEATSGKDGGAALREIGAVDALRRLAAAPATLPSSLAARALKAIGEPVPETLSPRVPLWTEKQVQSWLSLVGFENLIPIFKESRVDGDLLLRLTQNQLRTDIGLTNGILLSRFTRELERLKSTADYGSELGDFLRTLGPRLPIYTYRMLDIGLRMESLSDLTEEQLRKECGVENGIHRSMIMEAVGGRGKKHSWDVFVSYRRSNGSQLASLLRVLLELRGFTVFLDVEGLENGKFDANLLKSIKEAEHFLLVLTPGALDRCKDDGEGKDWVHKEVAEAITTRRNIVPVTSSFNWPSPEELPEDIRGLLSFNCVNWIHDYQDACVDKIQRFIDSKEKGKQGILTPPPSPASALFLPPTDLSLPRKIFSSPSSFETPATSEFTFVPDSPITPITPTSNSPFANSRGVPKRKSLMKKFKDYVNS